MVLVSVVAIGTIASACDDPNTTDYDPMGAAAAAAGMELADVPVDQVASCVQLTKFDAMSGDVVAQERWNSVGQSDDALSAACTEIGRTEPARLAQMHWDWTAAQSAGG